MILAARLVLAVVFAVAGFTKLVDRDGTRLAVRAFGVPTALAGPVAVILPLAEMATALALVAPDTAVTGAVAALVLLGWFMVAIAANLARGREPDCHCFGQLHSAPLGWPTLVRNTVLAGLAALVVAAGPGPGLGSWLGGLGWLQWLTVAVALVLAAAFVVEAGVGRRSR